ncbi:uncharacterized protein TNCV_1881101 [Trichonephila clavipes]|nr:uncharacterized protein TNCV_1881101 [Trichonephila clavipes]
MGLLFGDIMGFIVGKLSSLQQNVIAALFHCSSSVEKPMHGQCPIGKDSWCYYQRALSCGKKPNEKYKGLSNEVLNTIKPTYLELCTKELLTKCLHGKTQNSNECLNGVIWQRVPKEVFVCLKTLKSGGPVLLLIKCRETDAWTVSPPKSKHCIVGKSQKKNIRLIKSSAKHD